MSGSFRPIRAALNYARFSILRPDWWVKEQARRRFHWRFIRPGSLCFDIGANVGKSSALYLDLGARVVAVEPQERCLLELRERLDERRWRGRWLVHAGAVGSTSGRAELRGVADESQVASLSLAWIDAVQGSGRFSEMRWTEREAVSVTTLDALIAEHGVPDFCKIDVEGSECDVLAGLSQALPLLSFEFTPELSGQLAACRDRLSELGTYEYSLAPHDEWPEPNWSDAIDPSIDGDIYARLKT
jgi:FkbM family methyltransferase